MAILKKVIITKKQVRFRTEINMGFRDHPAIFAAVAACDSEPAGGIGYPTEAFAPPSSGP
jgi:hypothetical protein